jgi:hypothetical protein
MSIAQEAADALEALVAERDRLKAEVERLRNEKVGTHGSPELDEDAFKLQAMGKDPGMTIEEFLDEHFKPPATDPAPVCKWTLNTLPEPDGGSHYETSCGDAWCRWYNTPKEDNYSYCPSCGKPIKFTEAKE